jgi:hypothetical protein
MSDTDNSVSIPPGEILCPVKSINLLAAQNHKSSPNKEENVIRSQSPKGCNLSSTNLSKSSSSTTTNISCSTVNDQPVIDPETSETLFRNLKNATRFAIDIGGSLTKIAYFSTVSHRRIRSRSKVASDSTNNSNSTEFEYDVWEGARLHFIKFETLFIEECLDFIQKHLAPDGGNTNSGKRIKATGKRVLKMKMHKAITRF